ncbi:23S rRNA pseudouridine2605 synthase [Dyadobacter jejuensis]|uniref:Pseudouridine synthase n=1 Tax=Dyadobacter jejuensis TaxID=1082580 RepID=A0A316AQT6_9BACT|nr:pseudouridine synthase [Dyadobacter jejuensis]PWJ59888.1 23S rRNA pseudouridine2605 synthase [Dyadobacter jejuensis]
MRKRIEKPADAKASGRGGQKSSRTGKKSIDGGDWAMESRFSKPTIKKSSLRLAAAREAAEAKAYKGKPSGASKTSEKPWSEKPAYGKPSFNRGGNDNRSSEGRSFEGPNRDKPYRSFDKKQSSPGFRSNSDSTPGGGSYKQKLAGPGRFGKPVSDRNRGENDRGAYSKPYRSEGPSADFKKPYQKPWEKDREPRGDWKNREQPSEESSRGRAEGKATGQDRRVGRLEAAPKYNLNRYDEKKPGKKSKGSEDDGSIRLNRYIANAGICSRREADELIASGQISVNGKTVTEMGHKVMRTDQVKFGKKALNPEKMVYILINKPKDYITTTDDPEERKTVLDLIQGACEERVYPVGRLDRNTTGLLLLTNDGELAEKLTHPSSGVKKIYQAELDKPITTEDFELLKHGLELEDGFIRPDEVGLVTPDAMVVGLEIHSGRNRIVRRMFEHLGYEVQKLDRTVFAGLNKKELPRGKWRFLLEREVVKLKYML